MERRPHGSVPSLPQGLCSAPCAQRLRWAVLCSCSAAQAQSQLPGR